jgi:hypothetical protein
MQSPVISSVLVALVSVPGFLVGQKFRQGDSSGALLLCLAMMMVVMIASAIMRGNDRDAESSPADARDRL